MIKIKILIPVYNDWQSVFKLLDNINIVISKLKYEFSVIIINDASTEKRYELISKLKNIKSIKIVDIKKNMGHARCNATGLKYIDINEECDYVIPMDGDGEDRPEELKLFVEKIDKHPNKIITANRIKRSESLFFKLCYLAHKSITLIFTGQSIKFGNYTCLPKSAVHKMVNEASTWSSFSGSLSKILVEKISIPSQRGIRYYGPSKMSFFNLLRHSLSIITVFKKTLFLRATLFLIVYLLLILKNVTFITLIPIIFIIFILLSVIILSRQENFTKLSKSLDNIESIDQLK